MRRLGFKTERHCEEARRSKLPTTKRLLKRIDRNKDDTDCCTDATDFDNAEYCCHSDAGGDELQAAPKLVKEYIKGSFKKLIGDTYIYEAVSAHLEYTEQRRVDFIIAGLTDFVNS